MLRSKFTFSLKYFEYVDIDLLRSAFGSLNFISDDKKHTLTIQQSSCDIRERRVEHCEIIGFFFILQMFLSESIDERTIESLFSILRYHNYNDFDDFLKLFFFILCNFESEFRYTINTVFSNYPLLNIIDLFHINFGSIESDFQKIKTNFYSNVVKLINRFFCELDGMFLNLKKIFVKYLFKFVANYNILSKDNFLSRSEFYTLVDEDGNNFLEYLLIYDELRVCGNYLLDHECFRRTVEMLLTIYPLQLLGLIINTEVEIHRKMENLLSNEAGFICLFSIVSLLIYALNENANGLVNNQSIKTLFGKDVSNIIFRYIKLSEDEIRKLTEIKDMYFQFLVRFFLKYESEDILKKVEELFFSSQSSSYSYNILNSFAKSCLISLIDAVNKAYPHRSWMTVPLLSPTSLPLALPPAPPAVPAVPLTSPPPTGLHEDQKTAPLAPLTSPPSTGLQGKQKVPPLSPSKGSQGKQKTAPPAAPSAPLSPTGLHEDQKTAPPTVPCSSNLFIITSSVISAITMFMYLFSISQIDYICLHIVAFMPVILLLFIYFKVNNLQPAQTNQAFFASNSGAYFKLSNRILFFALFCVEALYIAESSCFLLCNNIDMYIEIILIAFFSVSILISSTAAYLNNKFYNEYQSTLLNR